MSKKLIIFLLFVILTAFLLLATKPLFHWKRIIGFQESQLSEVVFVGRVVDQNGEPVADAKVDIEVTGNYLASGNAGTGVVRTDNDGYFFINDLRGASVGIGDVVKRGYDIHSKTMEGTQPGARNNAYPSFYAFKEHENALLWSDYTREHPYIIKAYKVEKYAQVKTERDRAFGFSPNGSVYTLDFTGIDTVRWEGVRDGDIRVTATRDEKKWQVKIDGVEGGVQEANDEYINMAPETGYQQSLIYSGSTKDKYPVTKSIILNKQIYFMSQHGKRYGVVQMRIRPYATEEQVGIYTSYVINLEGGRELAVRPKE